MAKHRDGGEDGEEDGQQVEADRQLEGHEMSHHCSGFFCSGQNFISVFMHTD